MMDHEMRMEEIRRRSEVYIQKRKTLRRIVISCVTPVVCLCLCVGALWLGGNSGVTADNAVMSGETAAAIRPEAAPDEMHNGMGDLPEKVYGTSLGMVQIRVEDGQKTYTLTDPERLAKAGEVLEQLMFYHRSDSGSTSGAVKDEGVENAPQAPGGADSDSLGFTVTLADGTQTPYRLCGSLLWDLSNGAFTELTAPQLHQLQTVLAN